MKILERWLGELSASQRILDLGCGRGSLKEQLRDFPVFGVDLDPQELADNHDPRTVCAASHRLPFAAQTFDLIVCHHSLEHVRELPDTLCEIRRVLKPEGRLFVSVPDGATFSDRLYRLLLCGGGHVQQFSFEAAVRAIEDATRLHLAASRELFTSFIFIDKLNFVPAPEGRLSGPLPRRMRLLGHLPGWLFVTTRLLLNVGARAVDSLFPSRLSRYGWALAFAPWGGTPETEPGCVNVCMSCGAGLERPATMLRFLYRCPYCSGLNVTYH